MMTRAQGYCQGQECASETSYPWAEKKKGFTKGFSKSEDCPW